MLLCNLPLNNSNMYLKLTDLICRMTITSCHYTTFPSIEKSLHMSMAKYAQL